MTLLNAINLLVMDFLCNHEARVINVRVVAGA